MVAEITLHNQHVVILDTNVLYGDPQLRSGALNQLIRSCRASHLAVMLTEVVVLELVAEYESALKGLGFGVNERHSAATP